MGGVAGDRIQNFPGVVVSVDWTVESTGPFYADGTGWTAAYSGNRRAMIKFDPGRVVPTGATNLPRSWAALACVYLGQPATV